MPFTVRQARQFAGLTQQKMADTLGVHRSTYIKLEDHPDEITIAQARIISQATGISVDNIFFSTDST